MPKPRQENMRSLPPVLSVATLAAETINEEKRTVDLTFYSGAPVFRFPLFDDPYELEFDVSSGAAKLDRLNSGAPLIDSHSTYAGVKGQLGVVEKAWLADGKAHARVKFSRRPEVEGVWQDVLDGVVRNVSMGTYILEMEEVTKKGAEMKRMRATSWQPYELSLVPVPADMGAQVLQLAADATERPCTIHFRAEDASDAHQGGTMKIKVRLLADVEDVGKLGEVVEIDKASLDEKLHWEDLEDEVGFENRKLALKAEKKETKTPDTSALAEEERATLEAIEADKRRRENFKRIASHFEMDELWVQRMVNLGMSSEAATADATRLRAERSPKTPNHIGFGNDYEALAWKVDQMAEALAARSTGKDAPDSARDFRSYGFADCAHECLMARGHGRGLDARRDRVRIFELAMNTTSDFPLLLANALNKVLLPEYMAAAPVHRRIAARRQFNDFRPHPFLRSGDFPTLQSVNEHGEYTYGTMSENRESVTAIKYGRIFALTFETLVNDDLGAFADLAMKAARRVVDFEDAKFFEICIAPNSGTGPALSDAVVVYHSTHANVTAGGALSNTLLGSAWALMQAQTGLDGIKIGAEPRYLLTSPTSHILARTLLAEITPSVASEVNPFAGLITPLSSPHLSGTRFYVLADPAILEQYVYGYLAGMNGPSTDTRSGFTTDGVEFKVSLVFGCGAIEYRAGVSGAGS